MSITPRQRRLWRKRAKTIKRSAERLTGEIMAVEVAGYEPENAMLLSDWADNIAYNAEHLIDALQPEKS